MAKPDGPVTGNWTTLADEFIRRFAAGEKSLTIPKFAKEKGLNRRTTYNHAAKERWQERAMEAAATLSAKAWDAVEIDQVRARKALLANGLEAAATLFKVLAKLREKIEESLAAGDIPSLRDIRALQQVARDLVVDGAGLPKVHSVSVDDHHDEVVWNRAQMAKAEAKARELRQWAEAKGIRAGGAPLRILPGGKKPADDYER